MTYIPNHSVLLIEAVVHLLINVAAVLAELIQSVLLNALNLLSLSVQLVSKRVYKVTLHFLTLLLLLENSVFNLLGISCKVIQDHSFILHALIAFFVQILVILFDLSFDWCQLIGQVLNTVSSLLCTHVIKCLNSVITSFNLICLVCALSCKSVVELLMQIFKLFFKLDLVVFEGLIHLLTLVNCILFDVFDFSAGRLECK